MAITQKSTTINGTKYSVTTMDGITALRTQARLVKILGAGATDITLEDIQKLAGSKDDPSGIIEILKPVLNNFDDDLVVDFVLSLFEKGVFYEVEGQGGVKVNQPVNFETHFSGNINEAWKVALFILKVNLFQLGK